MKRTTAARIKRTGAECMVFNTMPYTLTLPIVEEQTSYIFKEYMPHKILWQVKGSYMIFDTSLHAPVGAWYVIYDKKGETLYWDNFISPMFFGRKGEQFSFTLSLMCHLNGVVETGFTKINE